MPRAATVLDFGCADLPYRDAFGADVDYLAADLPGNARANVTIADDGTVDVEDASVDVVLSTQVLEHVTDPTLYLRECERVLRPGGRLLLTTHGTMFYHPDPVDYWRWTSAGLRKAVTDAGLEVDALRGHRRHRRDGPAARPGGLLLPAAAPRRAPVRARAADAAAALSDRARARESRDMNAMVFALVAEKPA